MIDGVVVHKWFNDWAEALCLLKSQVSPCLEISTQ